MACQVIGPLSPTTWKLTASLRPSNSAAAGSCTKGKVTGSLHTDIPGAIVIAFLPAKLTGWLLPGTSGGPLQADMDAIEGDRPGPERVGKPEPRLAPPQIRPNNQAKVLVTGTGRGRGKGEAQIRLS